MSQAIRTVDLIEADRSEPVPGLVEQTLFRVGDYRLVLFGTSNRSSWHCRDGATFGWVRTGSGHVTDDKRTTVLKRGDFIRVPPDTVHRYDAGDEQLEVLAVVNCGPGTTVGEPQSASDGDAGVDVIGPNGLVPTVESPNLTRETPFPDSDILMMRVRAAGGAAAGWHHHGENIYFGYAVDGPSETEYGSAGEEVARIERDECFHVPPGLVHRDTNPTDVSHTGIIWLCGGEPWVVNVDGPK